MQEKFNTSDLALAAALVYRGFVVLTIDATDVHRAKFVFDHTAKLEENIKAFWDGRLFVDAMRYHRTVKQMKVRLVNTEINTH